MNAHATSNTISCLPRASDKAPIFEEAVGNVWKEGVIQGGEPVEKKIGFATLFFFHLKLD
jgi:hypothetical protein